MVPRRVNQESLWFAWLRHAHVRQERYAEMVKHMFSPARELECANISKCSVFGSDADIKKHCLTACGTSDSNLFSVWFLGSLVLHASCHGSCVHAAGVLHCAFLLQLLYNISGLACQDWVAAKP
eukprot:5001975-Amphidinium_carterae.1